MSNKRLIAIGLGSNLGDRLGTIQEACAILKNDVIENALMSSVIETEPWGFTDQPKFLNAVIVGESDWKAPAIVNYLKSVERDLGRKSREKNGPREIDMDLLLIDGEAYECEGVQVPHPGVKDREFVRKPLQEVWPKAF